MSREMPKQQTISESISFKGVGLHTGEQVLMTLEPAKENHGYKFQRMDIDGSPIIPVDPDLVNDTQRCTTLQKGDVKITLSNTSLLKKITKYNPVINYKIGIKKFLKWYFSYYKIINK